MFQRIISNIADAPLRGDCEALRKLGLADVSEDAKKTLPGIWLSAEMKLGKRLSSKSHLVKRSVCQLHERRSQITTVDDMYDK